MKGIVFNLLQEAVEDKFGEQAWDELLESSGLEGIYTSLGSYPVNEFSRIVSAASKPVGMSEDEVVIWVGEHAFAQLAKRYPEMFRAHTSVRAFLLALNDMIHPEVQKLYPGAETPHFSYTSEPNGSLTMAYRSSRRLCSFATGLIKGCSTYFQEPITLAHPSCMKRGDSECVFSVSFATADE